MKSVWKCMHCGRNYLNTLLDVDPNNKKHVFSCLICHKGPMVYQGPIYTTKKEVREE